MATTLKDTLAQLKSLRDEKVYAQNKKRGAGDNQFGVKMGDIRKIAARSKPTIRWPLRSGTRETLMPGCWPSF